MAEWILLLSQKLLKVTFSRKIIAGASAFRELTVPYHLLVT